MRLADEQAKKKYQATSRLNKVPSVRQAKKKYQAVRCTEQSVGIMGN